MQSTVDLQTPASIDVSGQRTPARITSIDIFRGLTMMVMIFVNELDGTKGLPWWTFHAPAKVDAMTYVDMVFPAFLFIVGMSFPLSVKARLRKNSSTAALWLHVIRRTISLVVLGVILANAEKGSRALMGISPNLWGFTALIGAMLFWNVYRGQARIPRAIGLVLIVAMFAIFRRTTPSGQVAWIDISYWEILGLIGWTYLAMAILYIPTRKWRWAPITWFVLLLLLNCFTVAKWIAWPDRLPFYFWPFNSGAFVLISMAGVITSQIFLTGEEGYGRKALPALIFGIALAIAGWLLIPLGISKIRATPTWCLLSAASSVLIFAALYWICDVKRWTRWASFVRPAGANTLTTYLLPDLYYFAFAAMAFTSALAYGLPGVLKTVVFTGLMLALSALVTRIGIRLQL